MSHRAAAVLLLLATCSGAAVSPSASAAQVPAGETLPQKQAACQRGDMAACVRTGRAYEDGAGVQANPATAATFYRRACDGKDGDGCARLGWLVFTGKGVPRNFDEGYALIEKGCDDLRSGEACYIASVVNYASDGEELRALGARKLMEACGNGYVEGCYEMALNWLEGSNGFERDVVAGVVILEEEACKKGHATACAAAGYEWEWNEELPNDAARAVQLYRQACDAGAQLGCVYLGVAYGNGAGGLARDPARAVQLYTRACDGDMGGACSLLADAYRQGSGVARDAARADALVRKGCELKSPYCGQQTAAAAPAAAVAASATPSSSPTPAVQRQARVWPPVAPDSHLGKGIALYREKDFQPALAEFIAATRESPDDARAFAFMGDTYRWLGMRTESAAAMDRALQLDPDALDALR